jgi:hypothetical protein
VDGFTARGRHQEERRMIRFRLWSVLFALGLPLLTGCCCGPHPWLSKPCCPPRPCCDTAASPYISGSYYTSIPTSGPAYSPGMAFAPGFEGKPGCSSCGTPGIPTSNGLGALGIMPGVPGAPRSGLIYPPITTNPEGILPAPMSMEPPVGQIPQLNPVPRLTPTPPGIAQPTPADPVNRNKN